MNKTKTFLIYGREDYIKAIELDLIEMGYKGSPNKQLFNKNGYYYLYVKNNECVLLHFSHQADETFILETTPVSQIKSFAKEQLDLYNKSLIEPMVGDWWYGDPNNDNNIYLFKISEIRYDKDVVYSKDYYNKWPENPEWKYKKVIPSFAMMKLTKLKNKLKKVEGEELKELFKQIISDKFNIGDWVIYKNPDRDSIYFGKLVNLETLETSNGHVITYDSHDNIIRVSQPIKNTTLDFKTDDLGDFSVLSHDQLKNLFISIAEFKGYQGGSVVRTKDGVETLPLVDTYHFWQMNDTVFSRTTWPVLYYVQNNTWCDIITQPIKFNINDWILYTPYENNSKRILGRISSISDGRIELSNTHAINYFSNGGIHSIHDNYTDGKTTIGYYFNDIYKLFKVLSEKELEDLFIEIARFKGYKDGISVRGMRTNNIHLLHPSVYWVLKCYGFCHCSRAIWTVLYDIEYHKWAEIITDNKTYTLDLTRDELEYIPLI